MEVAHEKLAKLGHMRKLFEEIRVDFSFNAVIESGVTMCVCVFVCIIRQVFENSPVTRIKLELSRIYKCREFAIKGNK